MICLNFSLKTTSYHLINQVLSKVTHVIISFYLLHMKFINRLTENSFEVRGIFLDISKVFDKVWHSSYF